MASKTRVYRILFFIFILAWLIVFNVLLAASYRLDTASLITGNVIGATGASTSLPLLLINFLIAFFFGESYRRWEKTTLLRKEKRSGQAAFEFLWTYGWALLAVVLTTSTLVFTKVDITVTPSTCVLEQGLVCEDYEVYYDAATNHYLVSLIVRNPYDLDILDLSFVSLADMVCSITGAGGSPPPTTIPAGGTGMYFFDCIPTDGLSGAAIFTGQAIFNKEFPLQVTYRRADSALPHTVKGSVITKPTSVTTDSLTTLVGGSYNQSNNATHYECQNNACVALFGSGTNLCSSNADCANQTDSPTNTTHLACVNQACVAVTGTGTNLCTLDSDCITPPGNTSNVTVPKLPFGGCLYRFAYNQPPDKYIPVPAYTAPDAGYGYVRLVKTDVKSLEAVRKACKKTDFADLLKEYCKSYPTKPTQDQVVFYNSKGEFVSVCGAKGCGKVTCPP